MITIAATETASLVALTLPSTPHSVQMARFCIRAALTRHKLGDYTRNAETVTSELVTNAIMHAGGPKFGLEALHLAGSGAVAVIVTDLSPDPPVRREHAEDTEHGRGLNIVEALSASWGWLPEDPGKAVYAILAGGRRTVPALELDLGRRPENGLRSAGNAEYDQWNPKPGQPDRRPGMTAAPQPPPHAKPGQTVTSDQPDLARLVRRKETFR